MQSSAMPNCSTDHVHPSATRATCLPSISSIRNAKLQADVTNARSLRRLTHGTDRSLDNRALLPHVMLHTPCQRASSTWGVRVPTMGGGASFGAILDTLLLGVGAAKGARNEVVACFAPGGYRRARTRWLPRSLAQSRNCRLHQVKTRTGVGAIRRCNGRHWSPTLSPDNDDARSRKTSMRII